MDHVDEWISAEFANLAEVLYDYDHNLALEMVPPKEWVNLVDKSKVFRVIDTKRNQIVLYADSLSNPDDILGRIWAADQNTNDPLAIMDAKNRAAEALAAKKRIDEIEAEKDFALFAIKNTKSRWHHNGRIRDEHFRDQGPVRKYIVNNRRKVK